MKKLRDNILKNSQIIIEALAADLGKSETEGFLAEISLTLSEISHMLKNLNKYAKDKTVKTGLANFVAHSFIKKSPYGTVLIISPWNYPFLLAMEPLVDALAAGNTVVLKPSAYSPHTSKVIKKIISETFDEKEVAVIEGGREENQCLLEQKFDYIFFTGSKAVGQKVLEAAAKHITPTTLELGGKSPCIIEKTANIALAAKRIVFGKFLNCGQTCVAPDYILCDQSAKEELIKELKKQIKSQFTDSPLNNMDYGKIINKKHFDRLLGLINSEKVVHGGQSDENTLKIEPTVMDNVTCEDKIMQEEIFGPILPVLTYDTIDEVISKVNAGEKPLALYIFSENKKIINKVLNKCQFGGGCVNDVIMHLVSSDMGFGGVGESGMGSYHGKYGFDTFTHEKSIVDKKTFIDLDIRYQPYTKLKTFLLKALLK